MDTFTVKILLNISNPVNIYLSKFNKRNTRKRCEICLKQTIKTTERRQWLWAGKYLLNKFCTNIYINLELILRSSLRSLQRHNIYLQQCKMRKMETFAKIVFSCSEFSEGFQLLWIGLCIDQNFQKNLMIFAVS